MLVVCMSNRKSMTYLHELFHGYYSKLQELNQTAVRDQKLDCSVVSETELAKRLSGKINPLWGQYFLLSQIGYLRINLFAEYYARINAARENKDFNKGIHLMNEYLETVAKPFLIWQVQNSFTGRLRDLVSGSENRRIINQTLVTWAKDYGVWLKLSEDAKAEKNLNEEFGRMMINFNTLYTYSFSSQNFPPVATEPTH
jgi:hypothetical protein